MDRIFYIASLNPVSYNDINITIYCKTGIDQAVCCIVVSAGFADTSHIVFIGIRGGSGSIIEIIAFPSITGFNNPDDRVLFPVDSALVTGENPNRIGIRFVRIRIRCQGGQCKRCDHADCNQDGSDTHEESPAIFVLHSAHALPPLCLRLSRRL